MQLRGEKGNSEQPRPVLPNQPGEPGEPGKPGKPDIDVPGADPEPYKKEEPNPWQPVPQPGFPGIPNPGPDRDPEFPEPQANPERFTAWEEDEHIERGTMEGHLFAQLKYSRGRLETRSFLSEH